MYGSLNSHNPYFNRWFSAIFDMEIKFPNRFCHNPYSIDGFLQLQIHGWMKMNLKCHNPYFNRWFSAILYVDVFKCRLQESQSLF